MDQAMNSFKLTADEELRSLLATYMRKRVWTVEDGIYFWVAYQCFVHSIGGKTTDQNDYETIVVSTKEIVFALVNIGALHLAFPSRPFKTKFGRMASFFNDCWKSVLLNITSVDDRLLSQHIIPSEFFHVLKQRNIFPGNMIDISDKSLRRSQAFWLIMHDRLDNQASPFFDEDAYNKTLNEVLNRRNVANPGAAVTHGRRDDFSGRGRAYMEKLLLLGCKCRHDQLAKITLEFGIDIDGNKISDLAAKLKTSRFNPVNALKREAFDVVPEERRFNPKSPETKYDASKCICPNEEHQSFKPPRKNQK